MASKRHNPGKWKLLRFRLPVNSNDSGKKGHSDRRKKDRFFYDYTGYKRFLRRKKRREKPDIDND